MSAATSPSRLPRHTRAIAVIALASWFAGSPSQAAAPQLGGAMKHIFITLHEPSRTLFHYIQDGADERVLLMDYGETYTGAEVVLNDTHYSGRYGWVADGNWSVPAQRKIYIRLESSTEGLDTFEENTFTPLFGTGNASPVWLWDTTMVHNWYAAVDCGKYDATYRVYVGDLSGVEDASYTPTYVTLHWQYSYSGTELPGDADGDGDVDLADFAAYQRCHSGAGQPAPAPDAICGCFDFDVDEDVDLSDYAIIHEELSSPVN